MEASYIKSKATGLICPARQAKASTSHAFPDRAPNQSYGTHDRFPASFVVLVVPPSPRAPGLQPSSGCMLASLAPRSRSFILPVAFRIEMMMMILLILVTSPWLGDLDLFNLRVYEGIHHSDFWTVEASVILFSTFICFRVLHEVDRGISYSMYCTGALSKITVQFVRACESSRDPM